MPFFLMSDTHAADPLWEVLAGGRIVLLDAIKATYGDLMATASHVRSDGYLTKAMTLQVCRGRQKVLDALTKSVLDRPPRLHRKGDECECLAGSVWIDGYDYRIHQFLKRNPSKRENDRNREQKADLRDSRLKTAVYQRDGGCCRYCRSGPLSPKAGRAKDRRRVLQYDHVDPDRPAGPDGEGLVVSCARCNEHKGHRTPNEADMLLLPVPTDAERAQWAALDEPARNDLPTDHQPITDETATDHQHVGDPVGESITDPPQADPPPAHDNSREQLRPNTTDLELDQRGTQPAKGPGWGGHPIVGDTGTGLSGHSPPPQPPRSPAAPDIYTRRSRASGPKPPGGER